MTTKNVVLIIHGGWIVVCLSSLVELYVLENRFDALVRVMSIGCAHLK
nr:hypothetical protein [Tanacetum cinerariifolium]